MSKKKGNKFEDKVQKCINSGQLWFQKSDLSMDNFVIECKFTDKKGFKITTSILEKLWNEALNASKEPILEIGIRRNDKEIFKLQAILSLEKL
jgi:hypothetical protein